MRARQAWRRPRSTLTRTSAQVRFGENLLSSLTFLTVWLVLVTAFLFWRGGVELTGTHLPGGCVLFCPVLVRAACTASFAPSFSCSLLSFGCGGSAGPKAFFSFTHSHFHISAGNSYFTCLIYSPAHLYTFNFNYIHK